LTSSRELPRSIYETRKFINNSTFFSDIWDLNPLMRQLAQFTKLEELNLQKNPFIKLPADLSCLKQLTTLNIMEVTFADFGAAVHAIVTIPRLKVLYIGMT